MSRKNKGFTLVEMSMVLVAIAFVIGAIMAGQTLIRNARLLTISSDVEAFKEAMISFKNKYRYLPGDMPNATAFWGADVSCPITPANAVPKPQTCNGNGDSYIGDSNGSPFGNANSWYESYRAWQQLANAGFIRGNFSGTVSSRLPQGADPGLNIPSSRILGNGYSVLHVIPGLSAGVYNSNYHHVIIYGKPIAARASTHGAALSPDEALILDKKIDDGKPGSGFVLSFTEETVETGNCVTSKSELGAQYNTDIDDISCALIFITGM